MLDWPEADDLRDRRPTSRAAMEVIRSFDDAVATARQAR
jgi:isoleucyl-tRNA synthetase